jgi:uncharacterized protein (DUF2236 family)
LVAFQRFLGPLSLAERRRFYDESRVTARLFGIADADVPPTYEAFQAYVRAMLRGPQLAVSRDSRAIAAALLSPPLPPGLRQIASTTRLFTIGLLPPVMRQRYGYSWGPLRERALDATAAAVRTGVPWLPSLLRHFPTPAASQRRERRASHATLGPALGTLHSAIGSGRYRYRIERPSRRFR